MFEKSFKLFGYRLLDLSVLFKKGFRLCKLLRAATVLILPENLCSLNLGFMLWVKYVLHWRMYSITWREERKWEYGAGACLRVQRTTENIFSKKHIKCALHIVHLFQQEPYICRLVIKSRATSVMYTLSLSLFSTASRFCFYSLSLVSLPAYLQH